MNMNDIGIWHIFTSLGIPGLALGIFYMLFRTFKWDFPKVPTKWVAPIIILFMLLTAGVVLYAIISSRVPVTPPESPIKGLIQNVHKLQTNAASMQEGPLKRLPMIYSEAIRLANTLSQAKLNEIYSKLDQARYSATAYLIASDSAKFSDEQSHYAKKTIEKCNDALGMINEINTTNPSLSNKLFNLNYTDKILHIKLQATMNLYHLNQQDILQKEIGDIISEMSSAYFETNFSDNYLQVEKERTDKIQELWRNES